MIPKEIIENVRRIEITTKRMVTDVFAGQYQSVFKVIKGMLRLKKLGKLPPRVKGVSLPLPQTPPPVTS